ncbi:LysR family transcriptional regulator [Phormidium tenue FACHB-886]|nr:LysR family transcriptional regulator [Phormidium tenue FACHB-886]
MEKFKAISVFLRVVEANSFAKAADLLGLTPSAVSKSIAALESELGIQLLTRSTRRLRLTEDGRVFYDRCRQLSADYEELEMTLRGTQLAPRGRLRVDMPVIIARSVVFPALADFLRRYPEVQIELGANDRPIELIQEGYDAVIRWGELKDSRLIARYLCHTQWITCASPKYLSQYGEPKTPDELQHHNCINYFFTPSGQHFEWQFEQAGVKQMVAVQGNFTTNNPDILLEATLAGMGIYQTASFAVLPHLKAGQLQPVLVDYAMKGAPLWLVYPPDRHLSAKMKVFGDFIMEVMTPLRDLAI